MPRHLKIAVTDAIYWGVTAQAADRGVSAAVIFGELVEEALRARAVGGVPPHIPDPVRREMTVAAGAENMSLEIFEEHLKAWGWMIWVEDRIEHAHGA